MEKQIKRALDSWTDSIPAAVWAKGIVGIGPVISAGLAAHIDITRCPTAGRIWRFAGLDPTQEWLRRRSAPGTPPSKPCAGKSATPLCGNNRDALPLIADQIRRAERKPRYAMGTVLCDPNGYFYGDSVPANELADFCREFPRIDVILNLNVRTRRLIRGCIEKRRAGWENVCCLGLDELPWFLNRRHWLIRNLISKGGDQFVLMIGRNYRLGDHRALGFHHWESAAGQAILAAVEGAREKLERAV